MVTEQGFINTVKQEMQCIGVTIRASYSIRRITELAIERGYVPCSLMSPYPPEFHLVSIDDARAFMIATGKPMAWHNFIHWKAWKDVEPVQQFTVNKVTCNGGILTA